MHRRHILLFVYQEFSITGLAPLKVPIGESLYIQISHHVLELLTLNTHSNRYI